MSQNYLLVQKQTLVHIDYLEMKTKLLPDPYPTEHLATALQEECIQLNTRLDTILSRYHCNLHILCNMCMRKLSFNEIISKIAIMRQTQKLFEVIKPMSQSTGAMNQ